MSEPLLKMYAVRNSDGLYFRARGYSGYGKMWVEDLKFAKIYGKPGPARSRITYFSRHYKDYPPAELIELRITEIVVVDETSRLNKVNNAHKRRESEQKLQEAREELRSARENAQHAEAELDRARKKAQRLGVEI
jgi:hypothetical protein